VKKLALVLSTFGLLSFATPVFACPDKEGDAKDNAAKTAEKDKKETPKKKEAPAKKKTDETKKTGDKVSMK